MNPSHVSAAVETLARSTGLALRQSSTGRLERALTNLARMRDEDPARTVAALAGDRALMEALVDEITVQETWFFRDPAQFDLLMNRVVPNLADPVMIWSAGCANGQEAYSLAMALHAGGRRNFTVVASDLSTAALARTRAGRYHERELKGLSDAQRRRYLRPVGRMMWEVDPELRGRVDAVRHNLLCDAPPIPSGSAPVVFCRNVLIYFTPAQVTSVFERLASWLPAGGWLFLGLAESVRDRSSAYEAVRVGDAYAYRTVPAPAAPALPAAAPRRPAPRRPVPRPARPAPSPAPARVEVLPTVADLLRTGEAAVATGDFPSAIVAFRSAVYLDPDLAMAHVNLALCFQAVGDDRAARREHLAARAALDRSAGGSPDLEGYNPALLRELITQRLEALA